MPVVVSHSDPWLLPVALDAAPQGAERTDIRFSTSYLRQCKAAITEGGIRVPGMMHAPMLIQRNMNITTPATTADFLPTLMDVLQVRHHPELLPALCALPVCRAVRTVSRTLNARGSDNTVRMHSGTYACVGSLSLLFSG